MENTNVNINRLSLEDHIRLINTELEFKKNTTISSAFHLDTLPGTYNLLTALDQASLARVDMKESVLADTTNLQTVGKEFSILDDTIFGN
jgi:hypothetical protein